MSCCAARPKNKRAASSPALLEGIKLGQQADNGLLEFRKVPKPKEKLDYAIEDYDHVPALTIPTVAPESVLGLATRGNLGALKIFLKSKSDQAKELVNESHLETGATPLLAAARGGHTRCIEVLLEHGAYVNQANKEGWTPLMAAVRFASRDTTRCVKHPDHLIPERDSPIWCVKSNRNAAALAGCS